MYATFLKNETRIPFKPELSIRNVIRITSEKRDIHANIFYTIDINECASTSDCHAHAICMNTVGSYVCTCMEGYTGDGKDCTGNIIYIIAKFKTYTVNPSIQMCWSVCLRRRHSSKQPEIV